MLSRLIPDKFILWLLATVALAMLLPVSGRVAVAVDWLTLAAIFALFFLHGVRLPRAALVSGVTHWRLHAAILGLTFLVFPLIGLSLSALVPGLLTPELWMGILFLCALPSTVQSSIAYTSLAGGNVAGAVAAAAFSNLLGVFLTPGLAALLLGAQGAAISPAAIGKIFLLLFLPFLAGHALRPLLAARAARHPALTRTVDKGTILLAVYGAFSAATVAGIWTRIPPAQIGLLALLCLAILALVIGAALIVGRAGGLDAPDRAAVLFCGSVKSIASGAPMARILFPGAAAGMVILPIMLFHTLQLIVCAWIAAQMGAKRPPPQS